MKKITAILDERCKGKRKRYEIGVAKSPISGVVYVKPEVKLPVTITVVIPRTVVIPKKEKRNVSNN